MKTISLLALLFCVSCKPLTITLPETNRAKVKTAQTAVKSARPQIKTAQTAAKPIRAQTKRAQVTTKTKPKRNWLNDVEDVLTVIGQVAGEIEKQSKEQAALQRTQTNVYTQSAYQQSAVNPSTPVGVSSSMQSYMSNLNSQVQDAYKLANSTVSNEEVAQITKKYQRMAQSQAGYLYQQNASLNVYKQYQNKQYSDAYRQAKNDYYWSLQNKPADAAYYQRQMDTYHPK